MMKKIDDDTLTIVTLIYLYEHQTFTTEKIVPAWIKEWIEENFPAFGKIEMKQIIKVLQRMRKKHFIRN